MRPDYKKAKPNIMMEIAKDVSVRAFVFTPEDAVKVMEFAQRMNPEAYVDSRTEAEREAYKEERDRMIAEKQMSGGYRLYDLVKNTKTDKPKKKAGHPHD